MRFVLASESARRVDLLRAAGYDFDARRSGFPEVSLEDPRETAETNARGKALAVAETTDDVVLAADTVVYLPNGPAAGRVLGQAADGEGVRAPQPLPAVGQEAGYGQPEEGVGLRGREEIAPPPGPPLGASSARPPTGRRSGGCSSPCAAGHTRSTRAWR